MSEAYADPANMGYGPTDPFQGPANDLPAYIGNQPQQPRNPLAKFIESANLCDQLDDSELARLGARVVDEYKIDLASRDAAGWNERDKAAVKLAMQAREVKNTPWPNASNIKFPTLTQAAIEFNARAYPAIVDGYNVVKGKALGEPSPEKTARAERVGHHMSYQLLTQMKGWEEDTDRLLMSLPIRGSMFRKTWWDKTKGRNCSELIGPDCLVAHYWAKDDAPRLTQVLEFYPYQIEERFRSGLWREIKLGSAEQTERNDANDDDAPHEFLEQHRLYDMDEDGYPEPYICTVHKATMEVVRIVARYDEDGVKLDAKGKVACIEPVEYFTKYDFLPSLDGSWLGIGFGQLLDAINNAVNTTLNQLMDAGTLANTGGGFIGAGATMKGGSLRFLPGEWKRLEVPGATLRDNIVPRPATEPSPVLFNLLGLLLEASKDISATKDILTGDAKSANAPVGTTLALIEQGLKVFTAIYKRIHRAFACELRQLFRLNSLYLSDQEYFNFQDQPGVAARTDYNEDDVDVIPVSDPTVVTDMQRIGRAQYLLSFLGKGLNDMEIIKRALEAGSIPDIKALIPEQPKTDPALVETAAKLDIEKQKATSLEALQAAQTDKLIAETQALGFDAMQMAALAEAVAKIIGGQAPSPAEGPQNGPVQPGNLPGMEGPPPDGALPPVPAGPAGDVGPPMGLGDGVEPGPPDPGQAYGGNGLA